jgi:CPA2 family monovalent cation:H+ antiporter-2
MTPTLVRVSDVFSGLERLHYRRYSHLQGDAMGIAADIITIVIAALLGGLIAHRIRQPLIVGYILAGVLVGPYTAGVTVQNVHDIEMLAEIGVALLLFTLGLEFSFGELKRLGKLTLLGTPLQILLCSLVGYYIAKALGLPSTDAIWIGGAISLSSTMVVLKTLSARNGLEAPSGRIMLGILIAQDLAVVPLMLLLPQLTTDVIDYQAIVFAVLKSAVFLALMYFAGTRILPRLFGAIAALRSRELFFLSTLAAAFGAGILSHQLGLSFALGAFVAGMLLSETDYNHQALSDVSTLRDLFALIFFVSVGMLFDPQFFFDNLGTIAILVAAFVLCKAIIIGGSVRLLGYDALTGWTVGFGLCQIGEFAFVLVKTGVATGSLSSNAFSLMISVTVVTMVATPGLFLLGERIARAASRRAVEVPMLYEEEPTALASHVILVGGGVVGQYVARVLSRLERPYVVVESDHMVVTRMRDKRMRVIFGDATHQTILSAAGLAHANLVVVTTTNDLILPSLVSEIRSVRGDIPVVVRVEEVADVEALSSLNVDEIVQPQLEVGLEMVHQALRALRVDEGQIIPLLGQLRMERYELKGDSGF